MTSDVPLMLALGSTLAKQNTLVMLAFQFVQSISTELLAAIMCDRNEITADV